MQMMAWSCVSRQRDPFGLSPPIAVMRSWPEGRSAFSMYLISWRDAMLGFSEISPSARDELQGCAHSLGADVQ